MTIEIKETITVLPTGVLGVVKKKYSAGEYVVGEDEAYCIEPGASVENQSPKLQAIAMMVHTEEAVLAREAQLAL